MGREYLDIVRKRGLGDYGDATPTLLYVPEASMDTMNGSMPIVYATGPPTLVLCNPCGALQWSGVGLYSFPRGPDSMSFFCDTRRILRMPEVFLARVASERFIHSLYTHYGNLIVVP